MPNGFASRLRVALGLAVAAFFVGVSASFGAFGLSSSAAPSFSVTLNGQDQHPTYRMDLTVDNSDPGQTLAGWNLTISTTRFTTGGARPKTLSTNASSITGVSFECAVALPLCTSDPTNSVAYPIAVTAGSAPVKFFNAAAKTGTGTFTVAPTVQVAIPANAYAGTYSSTLTMTLATGP
jgi:hypothetical protein